ncbi:MAG: hypothetical protein JRI86_00700 [Deltaproteobacteria bacterium]|jgi:hypothetical protein|nr:hypothetical protein [Deltaproteobacteria bacterium]
MIKEYSQKRFGIIAIEKCFIIKDQLIEALSMQIEYELKGTQQKLIGEILFEMGYMEMAEVNKVLEVM